MFVYLKHLLYMPSWHRANFVDCNSC